MVSWCVVLGVALGGDAALRASAVAPLPAAVAKLPAAVQPQPIRHGAGDATQRRIAVTFDDLPLTASPHAACDSAALTRFTERLVGQIVAHHIPATGLVVESRVCERLRPSLLAALLTRWLDAGLELGNHTASHPDLNTTPPEAYQQDIVRGERALRPLLTARGQELRYFRYPQLHTGTSIEAKREVERFLAQRGYTIAPVTVDNQEWVFAAVYARAMERGDSATARRVADAFLAHMEESLRFYEELSMSVLGYEVPQILLLHANLLNADRLAPLVEMLGRRGYGFVTLEEALDDPAYAIPDPYVGPRGLSWLQRWAQQRGIAVGDEPREPDWVAELFRSY